MSEPIRILHVFFKMDKGGAETFIMNVYRKIDRAKVQFDFAIHTSDKGAYDDEILALGGRIFKFDMWNGFNLMQYKKQWEQFLIYHKEYKIIHGHLASLAFFYLGVAKKQGLATINHCHGLWIPNNTKGKIKKYLTWRNQHVADYYFTCSMEAGKLVYADKLYSEKKIQFIPNGIDTDKYIFNNEERMKTRRDLGILDNEFVIGHVGRFQEQKNHKFLIAIFNEFQKQNPTSRLVLVGDGELRKEIEKQIHELGLADKVIFTGVRSDVPQLLMAMDCFVFPSWREGLPVTLIEAQAAGLSCVISDVITNEIVLTELITKISLNTDVQDWCKAIDSNMFDRESPTQLIIQKGFNIQSTAEWLEKFYVGIIYD